MATLKSKRNPIHRFNRMTGEPSSMNGKRASKNTHPHDMLGRRNKSHTSPVEFKSSWDTGVANPSRRRHNRTKELRAAAKNK